MIAGVAAYAINALFLKDVLAQINVYDDDCQCGCIRGGRIILEGYA
jgi:hypothetical protein